MKTMTFISTNIIKEKVTKKYHVESYIGTPFIGKKGSADYLLTPPDTSHLSTICVYVTCDISLLSMLTPKDRKILHEKGYIRKGNIIFHCYPYKDVYIYYYVDTVTYMYYYLLPHMKAGIINKDGKKTPITPLFNILYDKVKNNILSIDNYKVYEAMKLIPFDTIEWYYKSFVPNRKFYVYCSALTYSTTHASYSILHPFNRKLPEDIRQIILDHVKKYYDLKGNKRKIDKSIPKNDVIEHFADCIQNMMDEAEECYKKFIHPDTPHTDREQYALHYKILEQRIDNILSYLYTTVLHQDVLFNLSKNILYYGSVHLFSLSPLYDKYLFATNVDNLLSYPNTYSSNIWDKDILFHPIEEVVHDIAEDVYTRYKEFFNKDGSKKNTNLNEYAFYNLYYNRFYITAGFYLVSSDFTTLAKKYKLHGKMLPCLGVLTYNPRKSKIYILSDKEILQKNHRAEDFIMEYRPAYYSRYYREHLQNEQDHNIYDSNIQKQRS